MPANAPTVDPNPYAPPLADPAGQWPVLTAERWGELHLAASLVSRRDGQVVRIAGSFEAEFAQTRLIGEQVYERPAAARSSVRAVAGRTDD
jgi:hypothetical protein